ncbi:MAG: hypothetical protein JSV31_08590 [Desulfobacterales bacterium]|nr:MAG: hypothetical protein JSV31_08590 [Desulfobacterales bacterium]
MPESRPGKQMAIIASYFKDETYGLLGPQMAATIIQDHTPYACIVIAVTREDDKAILKKALADYFGAQRPIIGFSALSGREDLFSLAKELRDKGAVTILAGPQADVDFLGEQGWQNHPHRFKGFSENFNFGLHGSAEQVIHLLNRLDRNGWTEIPGLLYTDRDGTVIQNPKKDWNERYLRKVRWDNIYTIGKNGIVPLNISTGQVLQHIGCPYAARTSETEIDYPVSISGRQGQRIKLFLRGCSFCDVAADKGFHGKLDLETVISQIRCLPEAHDGRKIPLELINENPLPNLPDLLREVNKRGIRLSQVNLTLRADWFILGVQYLGEALQIASELGIYILLSSIGFESFDDAILRNLNKGLSVEENLHAIRLIRQLKEQFPHQMGYSSKEGSVHGFIHPTAWDTKEISARIQKTIYLYGLQNDILPAHSTPLIIHHASGLGDWIREIELREGLWFKRYGSIIGWWEAPHHL